MAARAAVRVGCCGFAVAQARYFRTFDLVEVQQTFYHPPQPSTLQRWRAAAPRGDAQRFQQMLDHGRPGEPVCR